MKPHSPTKPCIVETEAGWLRPSLGLLGAAWAVLLPGSLVVIGLTGAVGLARWWFLSSVVLSLAAGVHWFARRRSSAGRFCLGIAIGMTFGCLADAYGVVPQSWRPAELLTMIIPLFAMGHLAYIAACGNLAARLNLRNRNVWLASLGFWMLLGVGLWGVIVPGASGVGGYRWPTFGYTALLSATAGTMTALALQQRRFRPMALGAMLFLASDALLAMYLFREPLPLLGAAVWLTYGSGQMLIVFGATAVSGLVTEGR